MFYRSLLKSLFSDAALFISGWICWSSVQGVRFEVWGGGVKLPPPPPCLKLNRIMLKTSNLAPKYTLTCSFRGYTFLYQGCLIFADVSNFLQKINVSHQKSTFIKAIVWEFCKRVFSGVFSFCKTKGYH